MKAEDNGFPSILITEGTEPSAPAAGKQRLYIDSTTHKLKRTDSAGVDVDIESAGGGGSGLLLLGEGKLQHATTDTQIFPTGTTHIQVDSTNLKAAVTIPASGTVYVDSYALASQSSGVLYWGVWNQTAGAVIANTDQYMMSGLSAALRVHNRWKITGLTPGALTLSMAFRSSNFSTGAMDHGPTWGAILFQVWG